MKKTLLSLAVLAISTLMFNSCETKSEDESIEGRYITGNIKNANGKEVQLFVFEDGKQFSIDTAVVENDQFKLETKTKDLRLYFIVVDPSDKTSLPVYIISNKDDKNITVSGEMPKFGENVVIKGSKESENVKAYQDFSMTLFPDKQDVYSKMQKVNPQDSVEMKRLVLRLDSLVGLSRNYAINYIEKNPGSLAGWLMLREFYPVTGIQDFDKDHLIYFEKVSNGIAEKYPNSEYPGMINQDIKNLKTQIEMSARTVQAVNSSVAPDISLPTPTGEIINLSSLKGKVVLLDFWASWCKPCRMENPNVVANYEKYKDKGFTVYSVSLDENKAAWEKAITADNLSWGNHVSDLQGWSSSAAALYGVRSIPASFLLDENGSIVASNLRGPALEKKLIEILGE